LAPVNILQISDDNAVTEFKAVSPLSNIHEKEEYNNSNNLIANPKIIPLTI